MPPRPAEGMGQAELLHRLRYAIETAIAYPSQRNTDAAVRLATEHPKGLRSSHVRHNLGARRWTWLNDHGVSPISEDLDALPPI